MHQFSDRPFVAGSLYGFRSFRAPIHPNGKKLRGVIHALPWDDGWQEAVCDRDGVYSPRTYARMSAYAPLFPSHPGNRTVADLNCTCGYYAYFDRRNSKYLAGGRGAIFDGIVEGAGTVTVGSLGFRSSKARIVALVVPWLNAKEDYSWDTLTLEQKRRHVQYCPSHLNSNHDYQPLINCAYRDLRRVSQYQQNILAAIKETYPSVALFDHYTAAAAEFPLSQAPPNPAPNPALEFVEAEKVLNWIVSANSAAGVAFDQMQKQITMLYSQIASLEAKVEKEKNQ